MHRDFSGIDVAWVATDAAGYVAIFTTGGVGPVPDTALSSIETAEELVFALSEIGESELLVELVRPDDFMAFARRGFYAYDWSDVHRSTYLASDSYELQAQPQKPLSVTQLPSILAAMVTNTCLSGVRFGEATVPSGLIKKASRVE